MHARRVLIASLLLMVTGAASAGQVDLELRATVSTVAENATLRVDLLARSSDGAPQGFDAVDALLTWDPVALELVGFDDSQAGASFFLNGFLAEPDGINDDLLDGEVLFTALASPGQPVDAPPAPGSLVVTTFVFHTLTAVPSTEVALEATSGQFGGTRVFLEGLLVTGDFSMTAEVTVSCRWDCGRTSNDVVDVTDLLSLLGDWGTDGPCDVDRSGTIDVSDLLEVLGAWGPCP